MSHDKQVSLPVTLALCLALATACTKPAPPPQEPETPTVIRAVINTTDAKPTTPPTAFAFPSPSTGFAVLGTTLVTTQDAGQTWTQVATFDNPITQLDFPTPDQGWAITQTQQLLRSKDGGRTWQSENRLATQVDFVSPTHGFTLEGGALFATKDGGQTWTKVAAAPCGGTFLSFINPQDGWAACSSPGGTGMQAKSVYHTSDGGATWELRANVPFPANNPAPKVGQIPVGGYLRSLFFLDEQRGWIGLTRGVLLATTDGGITWNGVPGPMGKAERYIADVTFLSPDRGYVIDGGILYATADGGQTFTPLLPALEPTGALPMQMLDASRWVSAGTSLDGGDILWTDDAGKTWRKVGSINGETVDALHFAADAQTGWAVASHYVPNQGGVQTVYATHDGGATWEPLYQRNGITFADLRMVDATTLIASTNTGEVHISRDGGKTFTSITGEEPQPPSHTLRFISADKGWRLRDFALEVTTDGAKTWAPSNLKTRVVAYELLPDGSAWVVGGEIREGGHHAELFFTPDWGQSWTRIDLGELPGAGAVRCADRDHCLVMVGEGGRYLTADGGRTWEQRP